MRPVLIAVLTTLPVLVATMPRHGHVAPQEVSRQEQYGHGFVVSRALLGFSHEPLYVARNILRSDASTSPLTLPCRRKFSLVQNRSLCLRGGVQGPRCQNNPALSNEDEEARRGTPSAGSTARATLLHMLEFGIPPTLFLFYVMSVISDPNSPVQLVTFVTAAAAAMAAESVTFPMDALKAGLQLKKEGSLAPTTTRLPLLERVGLLYYGLRAALCRSIPYTGTRMMMYGVFKDFGGDLQYSPVALAAMASVAGIISQLIFSPMDLFKVRMQGDAARVRRGEPRIYSSLPQLMYTTAMEEGLRGMWTGCKVNAMRAVCMNIADQAVTDVVRRALGSGAMAQLGVSAVTGVSVVLLSCPADTVRSKLMAHGPSSPQPQYSGIMDTIRKTWAGNGIRGFYGSIVSCSCPTTPKPETSSPNDIILRPPRRPYSLSPFPSASICQCITPKVYYLPVHYPCGPDLCVKILAAGKWGSIFGRAC
jgi:hypothetical protein